MKSDDISLILVPLAAEAKRARVNVKCLCCGEDGIDIELRNDCEVNFHCRECDANSSIDEIVERVGEWINLLELIAFYNCIIHKTPSK